uniref:Uncharacterized protein n=1 Tax=Ditylenchus dipsaci TaxID=166011 RepID=A0A915EIK2_9BILA
MTTTFPPSEVSVRRSLVAFQFIGGTCILVIMILLVISLSLGYSICTNQRDQYDRRQLIKYISLMAVNDPLTKQQAEDNENDEQKSNAELRERYIRFVSKMSEQQVDIRLFENMSLSGKFIAMQKNQEHYLVDSLKTPTGTLDHSALRNSVALVL